MKDPPTAVRVTPPTANEDVVIPLGLKVPDVAVPTPAVKEAAAIDMGLGDDTEPIPEIGSIAYVVPVEPVQAIELIVDQVYVTVPIIVTVAVVPPVVTTVPENVPDIVPVTVPRVPAVIEPE